MFALRVVSRAVPRAVPRLRVRTLVSMRYTIDHEWISFDDSTGVGRVGITEYAQKALGDVVFVELPQVGTVVGATDLMGAVESVKAASDIFAPVSGEIQAVNETLGTQPGLLNSSAEKDGWLATIKLSDVAQFEALLTAEAYASHCEGNAETS